MSELGVKLVTIAVCRRCWPFKQRCNSVPSRLSPSPRPPFLGKVSACSCPLPNQSRPHVRVSQAARISEPPSHQEHQVRKESADLNFLGVLGDLVVPLPRLSVRVPIQSRPSFDRRLHTGPTGAPPRVHTRGSVINPVPTGPSRSDPVPCRPVPVPCPFNEKCPDRTSPGLAGVRTGVRTALGLGAPCVPSHRQLVVTCFSVIG